MPRYEITAPDGRRFEVDAPEGASQQDVMAFVQSQAAASATKQPDQPKPEEAGVITNAGKGFAQGVKQDLVGGPAQFLGRGIQSAIGLIPGIKNTQYWKDIQANANNMDRLMKADEAKYQAETPGSYAAGAGRVGANLLGLGGMGGAKAAKTAAQAGELVPFVAGMGKGAQTAGRMAGASAAGAGIGAVSGALAPVNQGDDYWTEKAKQVGTGALVGGMMPIASEGALSSGRYLGGAARSFVEPFTESGRERLAANIVQRFAQGGPMTGNASEIIPGSVPTLSQVTGNPGVARLERAFRDQRPGAESAFTARALENAAARDVALEKITGTAADLEAARASRATNAADDYLKTHIGIPVANTAYASLKETPAFRAAFARAQAMARNAGTSVETKVQNVANRNMGGAASKPETYVSGQGLQIIKEALDDQIDKAVRAGAGKQAASITGVKNRLVDLMDNEIPGYADARAAYAAASRPIDSMAYLQGLNLTDTKGNMTLSKVESALRGLKKLQQARGLNPAKSVTDEQIAALTGIRDDLLREGNTAAGRSAGSNTFQNIATNNILENLLPGPARALMGGTNGPVANLVGRAGNLLYSGANDDIQSRIQNILLNQRGLAPLDVSRAPSLADRGAGLLTSAYPYLIPASAMTAARTTGQ